ncbi:MAG: RIP metalloprotease RseP [Betaproteobacteria bacterium]|nr:RIP metalloprotease RseP [Betaproteobacteria bacterium]
MSFLWNLAFFVLAIAIIVPIHEFGHFIVARLCGVRVLRFSVGFGRPIFSWRKRPETTEWVLSAIPLGGYVKMLDEREAPVPAELLNEAFNRQSVGRRIAIVAAGPIANLILAVLIYWILLVAGVVEPRALLGVPAPETAAARAGFAEADQVLAVDRTPVASWVDFHWVLLKAVMGRHDLNVTVMDRDGRRHERMLNTDAVRFDSEKDDPVRQLGIVLYRPAVIGKLAPDGAAMKAGIQEGDRVVSIDGRPISNWNDLSAAVSAAPEREIELVVERNARRIVFHLTPRSVMEDGKQVGRIGVGGADTPEWREKMLIEVRHPPVQAVGLAVKQMRDMVGLSLQMMGRMLTGEVSAKNIGGPVAIAKASGGAAHMGIEPYLGFLAFISISIGILNLLPIPLLDGGHIMYYFLELLMRRPLSERSMEIGQQVGLALLAMLMAFAFFNDITRLFS